MCVQGSLAAISCCMQKGAVMQGDEVDVGGRFCRVVGSKDHW